MTAHKELEEASFCVSAQGSERAEQDPRMLCGSIGTAGPGSEGDWAAHVETARRGTEVLEGQESGDELSERSSPYATSHGLSEGQPLKAGKGARPLSRMPQIQAIKLSRNTSQLQHMLLPFHQCLLFVFARAVVSCLPRPLISSLLLYPGVCPNAVLQFRRPWFDRQAQERNVLKSQAFSV